MSHSLFYKDTGATTAYYQGVEAERKRIIKILEEYAPHLITTGLIQLIMEKDLQEKE